jgi:hypothetical protein
VTPRRTQHTPMIEVETASLRRPAQHVRAVAQYAKDLDGSTGQTCAVRPAISVASSRKPTALPPALSATHGEPSLGPLH